MIEAFLGIDLGTSSVKALVIDTSGSIRGSGAAGYPVHRPAAGHAEQDPEEWWGATTVAVRAAVAAAGADVEVAAIGLSGQMHGTVLLDATDQPLGPVIIWEDQRSERDVAEITALIGAARLVEITGSPVATGFQAATIRWLQREAADRWARVRSILAPKDELRRRLTGEIATDPSDGSGTLLLDVRTRSWSDDLLAALLIPVERLPPLLPSTGPAGTLQQTAASALGLRPGIPVATGAGDAPCGLIGAGIVDPSTMLLSISTGAQVMVPAAEVSVDRGGRGHTFCSGLEPAPGHPGWYQMGATLVAGRAMRWLRDDLFGLVGEDADAILAGLAATVPIGAEGLIFLPYLVGERSPHMDTRTRGAFLGLTARHGRAELTRATMEGVTMAAYDAFTVLESLGAAPEEIVLAGGGARSDVWRQLAADLFGRPIRLLATADQAAAGAAVLGATAAGAGDPVAIGRAWSRYGPAIDPNPERHGRYQELFAIFQDAYAGATATAHLLGTFVSQSPATGSRP